MIYFEGYVVFKTVPLREFKWISSGLELGGYFGVEAGEDIFFQGYSKNDLIYKICHFVKN